MGTIVAAFPSGPNYVLLFTLKCFIGDLGLRYAVKRSTSVALLFYKLVSVHEHLCLDWNVLKRRNFNLFCPLVRSVAVLQESI